MLIIDENYNKPIDKKTYIALGSFDGLHTGHMQLINKAKELAEVNNGLSMVYTFKNHPKTVVKGAIPPKLLTDNEYKLNLLKKAGIDIACLVTFSEEYMKNSAEGYIKMLIDLYNADGFVVGLNHKFGYKNTGNVEFLKELKLKYNFKLEVVETMKYHDEVVSSSLIRSELTEGNLEKANILLGRPYCLRNIVIHGRKLGRELGYPTANLNINKDYVIPALGIYYTIVEINNTFYKGISSVGFNPTIENKGFSIETHILDFNQEIYDQEISLYFIKKIRNEKKFNTLNDLIARLDIDREFAEKEPIPDYFL
ncbi:bifunctional riboflavin kinase/FAD synthetase [Alloiococcus sp. CFN-8]|uniref:bifunctional riboflavin kinase/FAD synthetase n=1 Tax=Alloiococcus sp. CFN-8 TaxID=3416081 RepID=UPI003CEEDB14